MADNDEIKVLEANSEATEKTEETVETEETAAVAVEPVPSKKPEHGISAMSDHELLVELLKEQKKAGRRSLITTAALVAICLMIGISLLVIIPRVNATLNNAYEAIDSIQTVVANADSAIGSVEKSLSGIDEMVKNVDKVVVNNTDSVSKTVDRMSKIDIDSLNKSIKDLSDIIAPMAKFFRR